MRPQDSGTKGEQAGKHGGYPKGRSLGATSELPVGLLVDTGDRIGRGIGPAESHDGNHRDGGIDRAADAVALGAEIAYGRRPGDGGYEQANSASEERGGCALQDALQSSIGSDALPYLGQAGQEDSVRETGQPPAGKSWRIERLTPASTLGRGLSRVRAVLRGPVPNLRLYRSCVRGKEGLEVCGPSAIFRRWDALPLYGDVRRLDNCNFSPRTVWADEGAVYRFSPQKPAGRVYLCEGSDLRDIPDKSYDFILSSHNLEHFANPVKALKEWQRVLRPRGALILVLRDYRKTFDHRREPTPVEHMIDDYVNGMGEDDLTHLPEILAKHDLSRDKAAGTFEQFRERSLDNYNRRSLHQHVFDEVNGRDLLTVVGMEVVSVDRAMPCHLCFLALQRPSGVFRIGPA